MTKSQADLQQDAMVIEGLLAAMQSAETCEESLAVSVLISITREKARKLNMDLDSVNGSIPFHVAQREKT